MSLSEGEEDLYVGDSCKTKPVWSRLFRGVFVDSEGIQS